MRTQLFRGLMAVAIALLASAPAFAQSIVKGQVVDAQGKPVEGAVIAFESVQTSARRIETKTDARGQFLQVGLPPGQWKVSATKDKMTANRQANVRSGENPALNFQLSAQSGMSDEERAIAAATAQEAQAAVAAMNAGNMDDAITKFEALLVKVPQCSDCLTNLGNAYGKKQDWAKAEDAYKRLIAIRPDSADAYSGLANVYNALKRFDDAAAANKKAIELAGPSAGGGSAEQLFNQGVILWNSQKYADAKVQFEAAVKADPNMALAHYQLGMAQLNLGQIPDARASFENYIKVDPNGAKAAEVKGYLAALPK